MENITELVVKLKKEEVRIWADMSEYVKCNLGQCEKELLEMQLELEKAEYLNKEKINE